MARENRKFGSFPFEKKDINLSEFKQSLRLGRKIDELILTKTNLTPNDIEAISEDLAIDVLNSLMEEPSLHEYIDSRHYPLSDKMRELLSDAIEKAAYKKTLDPGNVKKLNRVLLQTTYFEKSTKYRNHERITSVGLLKTQVTISFPSDDNARILNGILMNLSAGGMALIIKESLPIGTNVMLKAVFQDHTVLETGVEIKHSIKGDMHFIYGVEFVNLPVYQFDKFFNISRDYNACEERINEKNPIVCHFDCRFYTLCTKPEKNISG